MSTNFTLPNGEVVPVPQDVVAQGNAAQQSFYDLQVARLAAETEPAEPAGSDA